MASTYQSPTWALVVGTAESKLDKTPDRDGAMDAVVGTGFDWANPWRQSTQSTVKGIARGVLVPLETRGGSSGVTRARLGHKLQPAGELSHHL